MVFQGWRQVLDLIFPRACLLCRRLVVDERSPSLCYSCQESLTPISNGCNRCGAPPAIPIGSHVERKKSNCPFCKGQRWDFGRAWCFTVYQANAARAVRLMKESHGESLTLSIGDVLTEWLKVQEGFSEASYDGIVPIPQHWVRRIVQRYNQSVTLGHRMARGLGIPCLENLLDRGRWTQKQGIKTISERRENLLGAFTVPKPHEVRYRSYLLVDDVMTSGATLQEAARALLKAGARRVDAVVFARGVNATKPMPMSKAPQGGSEDLTYEENSKETPGIPGENLRRKIH